MLGVQRGLTTLAALEQALPGAQIQTALDLRGVLTMTGKAALSQQRGHSANKQQLRRAACRHLRSKPPNSSQDQKKDNRHHT